MVAEERNEKALLDVAVPLPIRPVAEVVVAEPLGKQLHDTVLSAARDLADDSHSNRVLPTINSCTMPRFMSRAFCRRSSSRLTSSSIWAMAPAIDRCSSRDGRDSSMAP